MNREQLLAQRAAAGAAYASAAGAYQAAYEELHANDIALAEPGGFPQFQPATPHGLFLRTPLHGGAHERVMARVDQINKSMEA